MKEQKSGIFKKLFGMDTLNSEEQYNGMTGQAKTRTTFQEDVSFLDNNKEEEEEVLPWERKTVQEETAESSTEGFEEVQVQVPGPSPEPQQGAMSWEELLNKIAPPPVENDANFTVQPKSQGATFVETVEQLGVKAVSVKNVEPLEVKDAPVESVERFEVKPDSVESMEPGETVEPIGDTDDAVTVDPVGELEAGANERFSVQQEFAAGLAVEEYAQSGVNLEPGTVETAAEPVIPIESVQEPIEIGPLQNQQVMWLLEQADEANVKGEFDKAEHLFDIACTLVNHPDVQLATAKFHTNTGNQAKGLGHCLKALELYPDSQDGLALLLTLTDSGVPIGPKDFAAIKTGIPENSVKLARQCLELGYLAEALNFFARAKAQGHDLGEVQFELGMLYLKMGNPDQAIQHFKRNLELTQDPLSACQLVELYLGGNQLSLAKQVVDQYLADKVADDGIKQCVAKLNLVYGKDLLQSNQLEAALDSFNLAMEAGIAEAKELVVTVLLQIADSNKGNAVKAQEYYEAAIEIGGFNTAVATKLAGLYSDSGQFVKALAYYEKLYNQNPMDTRTSTNLAMCYQKIGNYGKAAELLETLAQYGELDRTTREQLYHYYQAQGKYEEALRHLAVLHDPESAEYKSAVQNLAWEQIRFMVDNGDLESAWKIASRELQSKPSTDLMGLAMKILSEWVDQLIAENKINEALGELERGRSLGLNVLDLGLREASLYESIGNDRAALRVYEAIAVKAPEVWDKIKELYLKAATREYLAGNMSEARKLLEDGHTRLPDNGEIRRALGVLYNETGQYALGAALSRDSMEETEIQISTDHLNVLRPHGYRRIRLG